METCRPRLLKTGDGRRWGPGSLSSRSICQAAVQNERTVTGIETENEITIEIWIGVGC